MTYSNNNYGYGSNDSDNTNNDATDNTNNDTTNQTNNDVSSNYTGENLGAIIGGEVDLDDFEFEELESIINDTLEQLDWESAERVGNILKCHGGPYQLDNGVPTYDYDNINTEPHQFPDCPDEEFLYPSGWDYKDYKEVSEPTGFVSPNVRVVRLGEIGPTRDFENEKTNPGRINTLPNRTVKWITAEPKKLLWVHPFLERAMDNTAAEPEEEVEIPLAFTFVRTLKKWQSGKLSNSPSDFDQDNNAGFHSTPGGKFANISSKPTQIKYSTKGSSGKWIGVLGYSRGKEGMGYPDEPTEGLEYNVVGMSGWMTTIYNGSAGTSNNCGLKYAYTMNRCDTTADELQYSISVFLEWLDALDDGSLGNGYSLSDNDEIGTSPSLADLEDPTGGGKGDYSDSDKAIIKSIIERFTRRLEFQENQDNHVEIDYKKFFTSKSFQDAKRKEIANNDASMQMVAIFYDYANYFINQNKGVPEINHGTYVSCDKLLKRITKGEVVTVADFFNDFISRIIVERDDIIDAIGGPIDHEKIVNDPDCYEGKLMKFFSLVTEDRDVSRVIRKKGELCVETSTGFVISMTQFLNGYDGWCDACHENGGMIVHPDMSRTICAKTSYDALNPNLFDIIDLDVYYFEDDEGVYDHSHYYSKTSTNASSPTPEKNSRHALPSEPGQPIDITINDQRVTRSEWRGLWGVPAPSWGARPDWDTWYVNNEKPGTQNNFVHTYGPFNYDDMDTFYHWIFPPNNHELDPRMDYHITFWYSDKPDAPNGEWKQGVTTPPKNAGQKSKGFASDRPKGRYFRLAFCQWTTSSSRSGPKLKEYMYPPGYKVPGKDPYNGTSPGGVWFDVIVTPGDGNPFDHYNDSSKGPCYQTPSTSCELGDLHDFYWKKPINTLQLKPGQYYKIWTIPNDKQSSDDLKERSTPDIQGVYITHNKVLALNPEKDWSFEGESPDYWKEGWMLETHLKGAGEKFYRTIRIDNDETDNLIFASNDPTRANQINDWQDDGEPWVDYQKINKDKWIFGPAYWGELHANRPRPNFYDDKWQTALNLWSNWEYQSMWTQDIDNVPVIEGQRLHLSADRGRGGIGDEAGLVEYTLYDYDVYMPYDYATFPNIDVNREEIEQHHAANKASFIYLGTIKRDDYNGFVVTVPVDSGLIFHARNTNRLKDSWKNNGEPINIRTRDSENPRDERRGPAYWAFGDYGLVNNDRKGFRGYVDFNDAYWANPLNHWNAGVGAGIPVKKGRRYEITPGPNMLYTHRIIWGLNDNESVSPILYNNPQLKNDKILDTPNRVHYSFVDDNEKLLRPAHSNASKPIVVTAEGDVMLFGAFRYDQSDDDSGNPLVDRPTKEQWSRFGEDIDITVRELPDIFGCGYWASEGAHDANTKSDTNSYERPLYSLTDEMKAIVADDIEADPTSPTLQELEGQITEYVSPDDPSYRENWIRRFNIERGKNYAVVATDRTPPYHLSPRWYDRALSKTTNPWIAGEDATRQSDREFEWIVNANDPFGPGNIYDDEEAFNEWRQENVHRIVEAHREELWYDVFYAGKPRNQWSNRGERLYLELYEVQKQDTIKAKQYWTDWEDDNTSTIKYTTRTANDQLNNTHWTNPLYRLPPDKFLPGHTYKVWVEDSPNALGQGKPNPNYMTVFFADKDPNAITVGTPKDYSLLGAVGDQKLPIDQRWKGPDNNMKGKANACKITIPRDKPMVVVGAWHTENRRTVGFNGQAPGALQGWNSGGEEITLKFEEVPEENPKGPVYWGDHYSAGKYNVISDEANDIEDLWGFPDCGRGEDITKARDANTNPAYYTQIYSYGENKNEPNIRTGKRYRLAPVTNSELSDMEVSGDAIPSEYISSYPYNQRWWYLNNPTFSLDPTKSNYSYFTPGRSSHAYSDYHDIIADSNYMVFGAHSNLDGRLENTWSTNGEPSYFTWEILPPVPRSGPGYYAEELGSWVTTTWPAEAHFYHPLNTVPVEEGKTFEVVQGDNWTDPEWRNVKVQIIFLLDDYKNNWEVINEHWKKRFNSAYMPIPFEARHPEDLIIRNAAAQEDINNPNAGNIYERELFEHFYKLGPIIDLNKTRFNKFKVPANCNRAFFAIQGWKQIQQFNRDGENIPFSIERVEYDNLEGPLYWGDNQPLVPGSTPPPEFDNTHFENPLRHVTVTQGKLIRLTKRDDDAFNNFDEVDIYSFNHRQASNLDPAKLNLNNFNFLGTFKKTDNSLTVDPGNSAIIFSARKINPAYNKLNATDWSPKGEPHPFNILERDDLRGPAYYAEGSDGWNAPQQPNNVSQPDFSKENKWKDPIQAYRYAVSDGEFDMELTETASDYEISAWVTADPSALKPSLSHANPMDWVPIGKFPRGTLRGAKLQIPTIDSNHPYRYVVIGASNFSNSNPRTLDDWSEWGEPFGFRVVKKAWGKGPGYPAYRKHNGNWEIDFDENRWTWGNPLVPKRRFRFNPGKEYTFKVKNFEPHHNKQYQIVWSKSKNPTRKSELNYNTIGHHYLDPTKAQDQRFELTAPPNGYYVFFSMFDKSTAANHGNGPVTNWSPYGTSIPYTASRNWELPKMPLWLKLLILAMLGMLLALLGVLMYFVAVAPLDILLEMDIEQGQNEYDMKRKVLKKYTDSEGNEKIGFAYPNNTEYYDTDELFTTSQHNIPQFFNYTADYAVRAWAKIMKLRHNGYFMHLENAEKKNTSNDFTKDNYVQFHNMTPTFGRNFVRLTGDSMFATPTRGGMQKTKLKRCFRYRNNDIKQRDEEIQRFNAISNMGQKVLIPCTIPDPVKQTQSWDDRKVWFSPTIGYPHLTTKEEWTYSRGGAAYKNASNFPTHGSQSTYGCTTGNHRYLWNIFNELGGGFSTENDFSSNTSCHGQTFEIVNGDSSVTWDTGEIQASEFLPGIEFDLIWPTIIEDAEVQKDWQINQMHLNFYTFDEFDDINDNKIDYRFNRKLYVVNDSYTLRNSFENGTGPNNMGQLNKDNPKIHIKMMAKETIGMNAIFDSLSINIWIGSTGRGSAPKTFLISNLKPIYEYR